MKYIVYKIVKFILKPFVLLIYRPKFVGRENIPSKGRCILAGNHTNNLDAALMIAAPKRVVHMMAKKELFENKISCFFFRSMACIKVDRSIHDSDAKTDAIKVLEDEELLGIFPEGTINRVNDELLNFKFGAVSFAKKTDSYIVPFAITGKYRPFKKGLKIEFGKPYKVIDDLEKENKILMNKVKRLKGDNNVRI